MASGSSADKYCAHCDCIRGQEPCTRCKQIGLQCNGTCVCCQHYRNNRVGTAAKDGRNAGASSTKGTSETLNLSDGATISLQQPRSPSEGSDTIEYAFGSPSDINTIAETTAQYAENDGIFLVAGSGPRMNLSVESTISLQQSRNLPVPAVPTPLAYQRSKDLNVNLPSTSTAQPDVAPATSPRHREGCHGGPCNCPAAEGEMGSLESGRPSSTAAEQRESGSPYSADDEMDSENTYADNVQDSGTPTSAGEQNDSRSPSDEQTDSARPSDEQSDSASPSDEQTNSASPSDEQTDSASPSSADEQTDSGSSSDFPGRPIGGRHSLDGWALVRQGPASTLLNVLQSSLSRGGRCTPEESLDIRRTVEVTVGCRLISSSTSDTESSSPEPAGNQQNLPSTSASHSTGTPRIPRQIIYNVARLPAFSEVHEVQAERLYFRIHGDNQEIPRYIYMREDREVTGIICGIHYYFNSCAICGGFSDWQGCSFCTHSGPCNCICSCHEPLNITESRLYTVRRRNITTFGSRTFNLLSSPGCIIHDGIVLQLPYTTRYLQSPCETHDEVLSEWVRMEQRVTQLRRANLPGVRCFRCTSLDRTRNSRGACMIFTCCECGRAALLPFIRGSQRPSREPRYPVMYRVSRTDNPDRAFLISHQEGPTNLLRIQAYGVELRSGQQQQPNVPGPSGQQHQPNVPGPSGQQHQPNVPGPSGQQQQPNVPEPSGQQQTPDLPGPSGQQQQRDLPGPSGQQQTSIKTVSNIQNPLKRKNVEGNTATESDSASASETSSASASDTSSARAKETGEAEDRDVQMIKSGVRRKVEIVEISSDEVAETAANQETPSKRPRNEE